MLRDLRSAVLAILACTVLLGLAYPLAITGVAQVTFGDKADGSLVRGEGSRLIGQDLSKEGGLFQTRPSATGYAADATFFNNLGPNQRDLAKLLRANVRRYLRRERPYTPGLTAARIPSDAVTTSASGVDPDISVANARIQANRVSRERGLDRSRVDALIDEVASRPLLGLGGARSVNVMRLNEELG